MRWVILVALLALLGGVSYLLLPLVLDVWSGQSDRSRLVAALLGAAGTFFTVFGAFVVWLFQHAADKAREIDRLRRRRFNMLVALRAELYLSAIWHSAFFGPPHRATNETRMIATMRATKRAEHSMPLGVSAPENHVFESIKGEIADLPEQVIAPVIQFYQYDESIAEMLKSFSRGDFEVLSRDRRESAIRQFLDNGTTTMAQAIAAFDEVDRYLDDHGKGRTQRATEMQEKIVELKKTVASAESGASNDNDGRS